MSAVTEQLRLAEARVTVECRADGTQILRSPTRLADHNALPSDWLLYWNAHAPNRTVFAERRQTPDWLMSRSSAARVTFLVSSSATMRRSVLRSKS